MKTARIPGCIAIACVAALLAGCHSSDKSSASSEPEHHEIEAPDPSIPADSPFAKIHKGMSEHEVYALIGQPTDVDVHQTGKAWMPFHYSGHDDVRKEAHYKGIGRITFSNNSAYTSKFSVKEIHYDPSDPGYDR